MPADSAQTAPEMVTAADRRLAQGKHPDQEESRVSHETIYRSLYVQTRGVLKKELQECLRSPRAIRRSRHATQKGLKLRKIKDKTVAKRLFPIRICTDSLCLS